MRLRQQNKNSFLRVTKHVILVLLCSFLAATAFADELDRFDKIVAPVIQKHCASCHGAEEEIEGDTNLVQLNGENLTENIELVRKLIEALDLEAMPPADEPDLDPELRKKLIAELKLILHTTVTNRKTFAHAPIRRMNRFQYNNAVTDLFDLKCIVFTLPERMMREHKNYFKPETGRMEDVVTVGSRPLGKSQLIEARLSGVAAFPQDLRAEHGYDNRGDHLSLSPLLMESFLRLGQSITQSREFTAENVGIWDSFFESPENANLKSVAQERLESFLTKAFRRPVEDDVLKRYTHYVHQQLDAGVEFSDVMKSVAAATIASPKFLYLYDRSGESSSAEPVDDFEFASRLAFFLWGSLPDEELLELAGRGKLHKPEVIRTQVNRMLSDRKLKRFCDSFPSQWLQLERIISSAPDRNHFPDFYFAKYRKSMHMMLEPLLLFETVLIEDLPITQLIDPDFTYRSGLLESFYGELGPANMKNRKFNGQVGSLTFNRVPITDRRTGGVITNAAVMTMTSGPERTKPITRGAWMATVIFNNPPEPPPADVPELAEKPPADEEKMTLRERLAMHRERADCKGCHEQIDPLGFALENYDAVGAWRDKYENDRDVDMQGKLFRKHEFVDVLQFKDAILLEKDRFARGFAGHLLSFALARELTAADQLALDDILESTIENEYKIKTLITEIVLSEPFRSKTNPK